MSHDAPRLFAPNRQITAASASQLTATGHGFETGTKVTYDISGQTGLQTFGGAALGAGPFYIRKIALDTVELYDTKANAETASGNTGRKAFTAASGQTYGLLVRAGMCHLISFVFN